MSGCLETQADIAVLVTVTPHFQDFLCRQKLWKQGSRLCLVWEDWRTRRTCVNLTALVWNEAEIFCCRTVVCACTSLEQPDCPWKTWLCFKGRKNKEIHVRCKYSDKLLKARTNAVAFHVQDKYNVITTEPPGANLMRIITKIKNKRVKNPPD